MAPSISGRLRIKAMPANSERTLTGSRLKGTRLMPMEAMKPLARKKSSPAEA